MANCATGELLLRATAVSSAVCSSGGSGLEHVPLLEDESKVYDGDQ